MPSAWTVHPALNDPLLTQGAMSGLTKAIPTFGYQEWNRRLLRYYFGGEPAAPEWNQPVTHLRVTAEDLHQAAGAPNVSAADVKGAFLSMFASEHRDRTFARVASTDNEGWRPTNLEDPPFFVHLVVSCMVATEFGEDAYHKRLDDACGNGQKNPTDDGLPALWEQLLLWLLQARRRGKAYRALALPARRERGWTNIGYSIDLAFPRRGDRDALIDILDKQHLLGREPSVKGVLSALDGRANRFSTPFNEVVSDFRRTVERGDPRWNHAFWSAVREACLAPIAQAAIEVQVVLNADPGGFRPYVLARSEEDARALGFDAAAFPILQDWPVALHRGNDFETPVRALLSRSVVVRRVTASVDDGLLWFSPQTEDLWVWTPPSKLAEATHALVREDRRSSVGTIVTQRRGAPPLRERASRFPGWFEIENLEPSTRTGTPASITTETLAPPSLEVEADSGVPIRDGWLLADGLLPRIVSKGAESIRLRPVDRGIEGAAGPAELVFDSDRGNWRFPDGCREGAYVLEGKFPDDALATLYIRLYGTPVHSGFVPPTPAQIERSFVEGGPRDVDRLDPHLAIFPPTALRHDHIDIASDAFFLGATVGEWSDSRTEGFDWLLTPNARPRLRFIGDTDHPTLPSATVVRCKSAARHWRKCFGHSDIEGPPELVQAYRAAARAMRLPATAPGSPFPRPAVEEPPTVVPDAGVVRLTAALAAGAVQRSAIPETELLRLIGLAFELHSDWALRYTIIRAWVESGAIEEISNSRWSGRSYVVRPPRLVLQLFGNQLRAAVMGLRVPAVDQRLLKLSDTLHARFDRRSSVSPYAPSVPLLELRSEDLATRIEREAELGPSEWLPAVLTLVEPTSRIVRLAPAADLPRQLRIQTWDWQLGVFRDGDQGEEAVSLPRCSAQNQPDQFELRIRDGSRWSTPSRTWAFLAAHLLRRTPPFEVDGIAVRPPIGSGARLPVPLARALAALSPATGGPIFLGGRLRYEYWFPSGRAIRTILGTLFDMRMAE